MKARIQHLDSIRSLIDYAEAGGMKGAAAALYGLLEDGAEEMEEIGMEAAVNLPRPPDGLPHLANDEVRGSGGQTRHR